MVFYGMVSYAILLDCIGKVTGIAHSPFPVHASCKTALYRIFYSTMLWIVDELILDHRVYKREGVGSAAYLPCCGWSVGLILKKVAVRYPRTALRFAWSFRSESGKFAPSSFMNVGGPQIKIPSTPCHQHGSSGSDNYATYHPPDLDTYAIWQNLTVKLNK